MSKREIGTTFVMRAQDAVVGSPRRFRFMNTVLAFEKSKAFFHIATANSSEVDAAACSKAESECGERIVDAYR